MFFTFKSVQLILNYSACTAHIRVNKTIKLSRCVMAILIQSPNPCGQLRCMCAVQEIQKTFGARVWILYSYLFPSWHHYKRSAITTPLYRQIEDLLKKLMNEKDPVMDEVVFFSNQILTLSNTYLVYLLYT